MAGASACHAADRVTAALDRAGFHSTARRDLTFAIDLPPLDDYIAGHLSSIPWGQTLVDTAGDEALTRAAETIRTQLPAATTTFPFTATLVTAVR